MPARSTSTRASARRKSCSRTCRSERESECSADSISPIAASCPATSTTSAVPGCSAVPGALFARMPARYHLACLRQASKSGGQHGEETPAEQVGVAGPARGDVVAVLDDERSGVVAGGAAGGQHARPALELGRIGQRGRHLVLHVGRVGPVVAAEAPCGEQVPASFHVLGQAGGAAVRPHAAGRARGRGSAPARACRGRWLPPAGRVPRTWRPFLAERARTGTAAYPARARRAGSGRRNRPARYRPS